MHLFADGWQILPQGSQAGLSILDGGPRFLQYRVQRSQPLRNMLQRCRGIPRIRSQLLQHLLRCGQNSRVVPRDNPSRAAPACPATRLS